MRLIYLQLSTWQGISIGAEHWYGKLVDGDTGNSVELERKLTAHEARTMNNIIQEINDTWPEGENRKAMHWLASQLAILGHDVQKLGATAETVRINGKWFNLCVNSDGGFYVN